MSAASPLNSRRTFLCTLGASAASLGLPGFVTGCATDPGAKPIGRVVVIGGGYGGATAAKYLRLWSEQRIEVILVERNAAFVSCPLSNLVLAGTLRIEELTIGYDALRGRGVRVVHDEVKTIDPEKKQLTLGRGAPMTYDRLVVSPGIDFLFNELPGLRNAEVREGLPHAWRAGPETIALRRQLEAMPDGGVYVLAIPKAPYRCPPGPYERVCQIAHYLKTAKPGSKIIVLDANPDLVSKKGLFLAAWNELYKGLIDYRSNQEAKDVDGKGRAVITEFDTVKGDVLNVLPPMRAGDIAVQAKLVTANQRWCGVNWQTMESVAVPGIHVLGDATLSAPAMPKSASMANNHAKIAASAIVAMMTGQPINPLPTINNTCYSYVSDREAMHVDSVHRWDAEQKTLVPVKDSGGVSSARSELEKQYADAWAKNIWADTLT
ncbi:MAG: NAD(P)/FAD-dependent oxidoreductase [Burkholderiales bacterium]